MITVESVYQQASDCTYHPLQVSKEDLAGAETLFAYGGCACIAGPDYPTCQSYCDTWSYALGKLKDGRYITVHESSDTSGHGCQCSGAAALHETLQDALMLGLDQGERDILRTRSPLGILLDHMAP